MGTTSRRASLAGAMGTAALLCASPCHAQERPPWRGFELSLATGVGGHLLDAPTPFTQSPGPLFTWDLHLGARVTRRLAFGLHLGGTLGGDSFLGDDVPVYGLAGGLYLRIYLARNPERLGWDPWIGVDLDIIARTLSSSDAPVRTVLSHSVVDKAVALPLTFGLDYRLTERLAVGALATLTLRGTDEICAEVQTTSDAWRTCSHEAPLQPEYGGHPDATLAWSLAAQLRLSLPR